ncbi:MAG: Hsp20/alpha crystallin family protein [Verrucomicrobia bacterium]|nr:Hsp20/alpha crystallin family protein [Verrucomicrobiota bacterium]
MNLVRREQNELWPPFERLSTLQDEINRLFESPLAGLSRGSRFLTGWVPALDVLEDKDNLIVRAELPGMQKEQIEIALQDGTLSVSGERKLEAKQEATETYRSERFYGRFHRAVSLPKPVQADKVKASYKDGILTVTLPKTEEAKPKQIEVTAN